MKTRSITAPVQLRTKAFTLVELLVVIGIIGVLTAITLPVLSSGNTKAKVMTARTQITVLLQSIQEYQTTYNGRFPVSSSAVDTSYHRVPIGTRDFTFGTVGPGGQGVLTNRQNQPLVKILNTVEDPILGYDFFDYQANNSEVIAILMDQEYFPAPSGAQTPNVQHRLNPQRKNFNPGPRSEATRPGIGDDLVYRDPWGNPYIISMSLDGDGKTQDAFYRMAHVSEPLAPNSDGHAGLSGLQRDGAGPWTTSATTHPGDRHRYHVASPVIVWSFGPDGKANYNGNNSPDHKAGEGDNKDNVLSWK